jgi:hypothetical protein
VGSSTFIRVALVCATALLTGCAAGSTPAAPGTATQSLPAITVPAIAATTVTVVNPAAGAPLVVNIPMSGGAATMTFPVGTTVSAGTQILVKTIDLAAGSVQAAGRRSQDANPPAPVTGLAPGLYVQVIDGAINLSNTGGSQNFAAGQFGFTSAVRQPPIVVPSNPGLQFTPPPQFAGPVVSGKPGIGYPAATNPSGDITFPVMLHQNAATIIAVGPASTFTSTTSFDASSTASGLAGSVITLPPVAGGFTAAVTLPHLTPAGSAPATFAFNFSLTAPLGVAAIASRGRAPLNIGGSFSTSAYLTLTVPGTLPLAMSSTPSFVFAYPDGFTFNAGESLYVALFDPTQPSAGWTAFSGPGVVNGQSVSFASVNRPLTFNGGTAYQFALISSVQTVSVPTAAPVNTPSPTPSATPSPAPSTAPTPFVATLATAAQAGLGNLLPLPATLPGLFPGGFVYSQTLTSATQNLIVSASTGNFASLVVPPGKTPVLFLTVALASGPNLTFANVGSVFINLAGTLFTPGTTYMITTTLPAPNVFSTSTVVASNDDHPSDVGGGAMAFPSPFSALTLSGTQQVGIVITR